MSTRSIIGYREDDGSIHSVYCHFDGHPRYMYPTLTTILESRGTQYAKDMIRRAQTEGGIRQVTKVGGIETFQERSEAIVYSYSRESLERGDLGGCECAYIFDGSGRIVEFFGSDQHVSEMGEILSECDPV